MKGGESSRDNSLMCSVRSDRFVLWSELPKSPETMSVAVAAGKDSPGAVNEELP